MVKTMKAVQLIGHGGFENLVYKTDVELPTVQANDVLIKVGAAGVNNTDINTRVGWYSKSTTSDTASVSAQQNSQELEEDAAWGGSALALPRIQGIDVCGEIVAVGPNVDQNRIGERVLVSPHITGKTLDDARFLGSEIDGGFAEYTRVPAHAVLAINSDYSDAELASFPCSYTTAENLLERSQLSSEEIILITGASGGVGSAAIQLAKRRGATIIAIAGQQKIQEVKDAGADRIITRGSDLLKEIGANQVDVVLDIVGGADFPSLLEILKVGGRYATSGAIAGPLVELDLRTLYLKDLKLIGGTRLEANVFPNLIKYIERKEIKPLVAKSYPLTKIEQAQKDFMEKKHVGKLVLIP